MTKYWVLIFINLSLLSLLDILTEIKIRSKYTVYSIN